jgi:hypothetical protein
MIYFVNASHQRIRLPTTSRAMTPSMPHSAIR